MSMDRSRLPAHWQADVGDLSDRVVLVTGAYGGLGASVARAVSRAGATVVLTGRRQRPLEQLYDAMQEESLPEPVIHPMDLATATPQDYAALVEGIERDLGRLDGIVHAAAHFSALTPLAVHKPDEWLRTVHVNLSAPFALTQSCMPLLSRAQDSAVVFVLDDPQRLARAHWGAYGVAKAGLERLVEILHQENDDAALRVHAMLPPPMRTALRRAAYFGENTMQHPLPDATATAAVYLLSPQGAPARGQVLDLRAA